MSYDFPVNAMLQVSPPPYSYGDFCSNCGHAARCHFSVSGNPVACKGKVLKGYFEEKEVPCGCRNLKIDPTFKPQVSPNDAPAQTVARAGADNSGAANTQYGDHAPQRKEAAPEEIISRNNRLAAELRECESEITDEGDPRGYEL